MVKGGLQNSDISLPLLKLHKLSFYWQNVQVSIIPLHSIEQKPILIKGGKFNC